MIRARVTQRLERAAAFPIALVVAPAGFGKSVALRDFIEASGSESIRFDTRREDGSLLAFVRRFSEALEPIAPSARAAFPAVQERILAAAEPVREAAAWLGEHLKRVSCRIAIDDFHYAAADRANVALLAELMQATSDRLSWIVASRSDVGLPVATWIAYGLMDLPVGEDDLRFTAGEAFEAAGQAGSTVPDAEVDALRELTEGWPVALSIALRTRTHAADLRTASAGTREMIYRYLAEQVFAGLAPFLRAFVLNTCVFSSFDAGIAAALGGTPEMLAELRHDVTFVTQLAPGIYRYHDLFRDFLESELRRSGEDAWLQALGAGAQVLESRANPAAALVLYVKAGAHADVLRLIERSGFSLYEHGEAQSLATAIDALPPPLRAGNAAVLGLRAMLEAARGHFDVAERGFLAAIESCADPGLRVRLVHRYAIELVRLGRDCAPLLEPYVDSNELTPEQRVPVLGTLATSYVRTGRTGEALALVDRALEELERLPDDDLRARIYQQAAHVFDLAKDPARARTHAELAVELALRRNLYEVAARAYSVLCMLAYDVDDDPLASLAYLDKMAESARKAASVQPRLFAAINAYDIEVERGNQPRVEELTPAIEESRRAYPQVYTRTLLPASAMQAAWDGDFARAYALLDGTAQTEDDPGWRALRWAEIAFYAYSAHKLDEGDAAAEAAQDLLAGQRPTRRRIRAGVFLALAHLLRGRDAAAHRTLNDAENALSQLAIRRLGTLVHAARALYRRQLDQDDQPALAAAFDRLRASHLGGIALLLEHAPFPRPAQAGWGALTAAEREILRMLARGASTKDVAVRTGRSPHTVDTHIRSICRKLDCSGRREAVALATAWGWVGD